jgi:hypothetical protein
LAVYGQPEGAINQGDIRSSVPFYIRQQHTPNLVLTMGLIVSHSCDIDKYDEIKHTLGNNEKKRFPILVAPLYGLGSLTKEDAGNVRAGRHRRYFYVPAEGRHNEQVADLWLTQPVPLVIVRGLPRLATLSREHLAHFWAHAFVTLSRKDPADVFRGGQLAP